jgi:hypothetical protein
MSASVPTIAATAKYEDQTSALSDEVIYTPENDEIVQISATIETLSGSEVTFQLGYTDDTGSHTLYMSEDQYPYSRKIKAGTNVTLSTSVSGSAEYSVYAVVVSLMEL